MVQNITQLRRIVFRKWDASDSSWDVFTLEADDLGQDTVMTLNVAPRKRTRASSLGSTESAISGTFDSFAGSITFLMDTFKNLGLAIQILNNIKQHSTIIATEKANKNLDIFKDFKTIELDK